MERTISFCFWTLTGEGAWSWHWPWSTSLHPVHMLHLQHDVKSTIIRLTHRLTWSPQCRWLRCLSEKDSDPPCFVQGSAQQTGFADSQTVIKWKMVFLLLKENQVFAERAQRFPSNILPPSISSTEKSCFFGGKMISQGGHLSSKELVTSKDQNQSCL